MKKNNLFKVVGIVILAYVLLSWIIPIVNSIGGFKWDVSKQLGFTSTASNILNTLPTFIPMIVYVLLVGAFYGVLKATGAYDKIIDLFSEKASGREKCTLILIIVLMALVSSLVGLDLGLLIVFPILIGLLVKIGYDKMVALSATLGATIVGMYGATFAASSYGMNMQILGTKALSQIVPKVIFFVLALAGLIVFVIRYCAKKNMIFDSRTAKKYLLIEGIVLSSMVLITSIVLTILLAIDSTVSVMWIVILVVSLALLIFLIVKLATDKRNKKEVKLSSKKDKKEKKFSVNKDKKNKSKKFIKKDKKDKKEKREKKERGALPALIVFGIVLLVFLLGTTNWSGLLGADNWFATAHTAWTGFTIGKFDVLNKLFGVDTVTAFGTWAEPSARFNTYSMLLIYAMLVITVLYRTKFDDAFDGFVEGLKSFIVPALLVTLACSLHLFVYFNDVLTPVMDALLKSTKEFNVFISGLYTIINSIFYVDYYYFASFVVYPITQVYTDKSILSIIDVMFVNLHSLVSLVAPSSVLLLVSLYIGEVRYGEWIKFIWKLALGLLLVSFIVFTIMLLI